MSLFPGVLTDILYPTFTMHSSFEMLHSQAEKSRDIPSHSLLLESFYEVPKQYALPRVIYSQNIEWNSPYVQLIQQVNKQK